MSKLKSKSSAKKRFKVTGTGKVKANAAFKRHCLTAKSSKMKRQARGTMVLSDRDAGNVIKFYLPYGN
ncbi:MAG TPA: 50S ribosomal protein L35 [Magnetospirillaceae bacterium]|jgi:large subunit ribosomal protein L35